MTFPKTTCFPSHCGAAARVKKNWDELLFFPLFAMDSMPGASCFSLRPFFSSLNFPLKIESPPLPSPERDHKEGV